MKRTWVRAKPTLLTVGLALVSGAAAGAVMAYMTGLLRGAFSSELFAHWAEIVAIAGTGIVAVVVARRQLSLGGHPKCTTRGQLKMYQGSVATFRPENVPPMK